MLHTQQYNSILQCGEKYFKHRNQDEKFKQLKNTQYPMIRENITETKFEDLTTVAKKKVLLKNNRASTMTAEGDKQAADKSGNLVKGI